MKLMKQTEDEYGFGKKGFLEVYCLAEELQKILEHLYCSIALEKKSIFSLEGYAMICDVKLTSSYNDM